LKIGLVFSGGGAKGAYEIGVWKAMRKLKLDKHVKTISGTSVGALNAVLFMNGSYSKAESIWKDLTLEKISKPTGESLNSNLFPLVDKLMIPKLAMAQSYIKSVVKKYISIGMISQQEVRRFIEVNIDYKQIKNFQGDCFVTVFNVKLNQPEYIKINTIPEEKVVDYLLASTAMPLVFDKVEIEGNEYYDGGIPFFGANTPIAPVLEGKCDLIISVTTNQWGDFFGRDKDFSDEKIIRIIPQDDKWGFMDGTFDFSPDNIEKRIKQGYKDAMSLLKEI